MIYNYRKVKGAEKDSGKCDYVSDVEAVSFNCRITKNYEYIHTYTWVKNKIKSFYESQKRFLLLLELSPYGPEQRLKVTTVIFLPKK